MSVQRHIFFSLTPVPPLNILHIQSVLPRFHLLFQFRLMKGDGLPSTELAGKKKKCLVKITPHPQGFQGG
jgi:hypothetical protein